MADRVVIDTDILIGLLRGEASSAERIAALQEDHRLMTTHINAFELYLGAYLSKKQEANVAAVKGLLNTLDMAGSDEDSMEIAARSAATLKQQGKGVEVKDILIGAMAIVNGAAVLTGNKKHFDRIEGLRIIE